ncbi:hypothetical protein TCAL_06742 [Tigriopus californicus]|uniref:Uncharacterized protein n=1 Tax=Tigriopus californicus TaxID=6832 RepID=A0A553PKP4_TIGCA|nr:hypothetical protein TCAL_06742 [Tigriopus californicus]|eukprot:TCALIF_06742-PA protein Name:"Protein of unknown function" AED:0.39 eAED:0.40 QI:0/0/0/0.5/0.66/0.75/4/0/885
MDKVVMVEETEIIEQERCTHINEESCFDVYKTNFQVQEVEDCKDGFKKDCYIEYHNVPRLRKVQICHQPLRRDCGLSGNTTCSLETETICEKDFHENEVEDHVPECEIQTKEVCQPDGSWCSQVPQRICSIQHIPNVKLTHKTKCKQVNRKVCGPEVCPVVRGNEKCYTTVKSVSSYLFVQEIPSERCNLIPRKDCHVVSKFVPSLVAETTCMDVPKEICNIVEVGSEKVRRPRVKKWCGPGPKSVEPIETTPSIPTIATTTPSPIDSMFKLLKNIEHGLQWFKKHAVPLFKDDLRMVNFAQLTSFSGNIGVVQVYNLITHETECQFGVGRSPDNHKIITRLTLDKEYAICGNDAEDFRACYQLLQIENSTSVIRHEDLQLPDSLLNTNVKSAQLQDGTWVISGQDDEGDQLFYQTPGANQFQKIEFYSPPSDTLCISGINKKKLLLITSEDTVIIDLIDGSVDTDTIPANDGSSTMCAALSKNIGYQVVSCTSETCSIFTSTFTSWINVPLVSGVTFLNVFAAMDQIYAIGSDKSLFTLNVERALWEDSNNSLDLVGTQGSQVRFGYGTMEFCNEPIVADGDDRLLLITGRTKTGGSGFQFEIIDWTSSETVCSQEIPFNLPRTSLPAFGTLLNGDPFFCGHSTAACGVLNRAKDAFVESDIVAQTYPISFPSGVQMDSQFYILAGGRRGEEVVNNIQIGTFRANQTSTVFTELALKLPTPSVNHCMVRLNDSTTFLGGGTGNLLHLFHLSDESIEEITVTPIAPISKPICGALEHDNGTQQIFMFEDWVNCQVITIQDGTFELNECPHQFNTPGPFLTKPHVAQFKDNKGFSVIREGEIHQINPDSLQWERTGRRSNHVWEDIYGTTFVDRLPSFCTSSSTLL